MYKAKWTTVTWLSINLKSLLEDDQFFTIPDHTLRITYGICKHNTLLEVANLIAVVGEDATAHDVRQR